MSELRFLWRLTALPADPGFVATGETLDASLALFQELVPASAHVAERFAEPRFFGSELFSSSAHCPVCSAVVHRDKTPGTTGRRWFAQADAIGAHRGPAQTPVTMPDCGHAVAIGDVAFEFPTGAACWALTAHFEVWGDEWFSEDDQAPAEPLEALSESLGTPLRFIRTLLALLPDDRLLIEQLMSADDGGRIAAARALEGLQPGHFEDNSIADAFIEDHADALLSAWHGTAHPLVRRWILLLLGGAHYCSPALRDVLAAELEAPGEAIEMALFVCHRGQPDAVRPLLPLIRRHHTHADPDVRWRCLLALSHLHADDPESRSAIRLLALDLHPRVRGPAVHAMADWIAQDGGMEEADRAVLARIAEGLPVDEVARQKARDLLRG
jgi:hypothetical protein